MNTEYWLGLIVFSILSACAAALYTTSTFAGGAVMGILYAGIYYLGEREGRKQ